MSHSRTFAGTLTFALSLPSLVHATAPVSLTNSSAEPWRALSDLHLDDYKVTVTHADPKQGEPRTLSFPGLNLRKFRMRFSVEVAPELRAAIRRENAKNAVDITLLPGDTATIELTGRKEHAELDLHLIDKDEKDALNLEDAKVRDPYKEMVPSDYKLGCLIYTVNQSPEGVATGQWTYRKGSPEGIVVESGSDKAVIKMDSWGKSGTPLSFP